MQQEEERVNNKTNVRRLTEAEWEVMEAIWALGGAPSVRDVLEYAYPGGEKAYTTVQTIMNNLVAKGFLRQKKVGLVNFYRPTISRNKAIERETSHLVTKVFRGSFGALAHFLINSDSLNAQEIATIRQLIAEKERELERQ
ncbi:MAG: BlaI/MecI/CopY family transcriptional regulator [candidate division KSB1 bacterium]|nr:BlaI/MecI/CopY family transcriptional regulator [candidate division KSB1 bacterium]